MDIRFVLGVLGAKAAIGAVAGFVIDLLVRERKMHPHDHVHGHEENDHEEEVPVSFAQMKIIIEKQVEQLKMKEQ